MESQLIDDVAIIGAGISGSYAAWRLRQAGMTITLYEYSDRIGGRCHTIKFPDAPDINVELGAMRFSPPDHVLLDRAITELDLHAIDFLPTTEKRYYLRGRHFTQDQLIDQNRYSLKPEHRKSEEQLKWDIFKEFTNVDSSVDGYRDQVHVLGYKTPDGIPLFKQSHRSFCGKYLYPELVSYLDDTNGFNAIYQDVSAAKSIPNKDPGIPTKPNNLKTVKEGFQAIPETMVKRFLDSSQKHKFQPNYHLVSVERLADGYKLTFQRTTTIRGVTRIVAADRIQIIAKKVLLAIPRLALQHLEWDALKEDTTSDYIKNSLYEAQAGKIYFSYNDTWWRNIPNSAPTVYSTTPLRTTKDFGVSPQTGKAILSPAYGDLYTTLWRNTLQQGKPVPGIGDESIQMTDVAQNMTRKYLAEIFGISESIVPIPNYSVMEIWDEYPIGASWYYYKPGYIWNEVGDHMLKPSKDDDVFIISNTFSPTAKQVWIEGALEIVDTLMKKYFSEYA